MDNSLQGVSKVLEALIFNSSTKLVWIYTNEALISSRNSAEVMQMSNNVYTYHKRHTKKYGVAQKEWQQQDKFDLKTLHSGVAKKE